MAEIAAGVQGWLEGASTRLRVLVVLCLVVGGLAIGYVAGIAGKADLDGARTAGRRDGESEARARATQQGYAVGLARGTREGSTQTYRPAYRAAYDKAIAGGG